jgi:hypothetical protein
MSETIRTGGCRCGRVSFEARGAPLRVGVCHCESCRRASGSAFEVFVDYPHDAVAIAGEPAAWSSRPGVERLFCPRCGSPIAYRGADWLGETSLCLGAFAGPEEFTPHHVTFEAEGLDWARRALAPILAEGRR